MSSKTDQPASTPQPSPWLPLEDFSVDERGAQARVSFPSHSLWFDGHFPRRAILPGVALLALGAQMAIQLGQTQNRRLVIVGFTKTRIRRIVSPGDELIIATSPLAEGKVISQPFEISCQRERVCQGLVSLKEL